MKPTLKKLLPVVVFILFLTCIGYWFATNGDISRSLGIGPTKRVYATISKAKSRYNSFTKRRFYEVHYNFIVDGKKQLGVSKNLDGIGVCSPKPGDSVAVEYVISNPKRHKALYFHKTNTGWPCK